MRSLLIALSKSLLCMALGKVLELGLAEVYKRLDSELPALTLSNSSPLKVQGAIAGAITSVTNRPASPSQVKAVIGLYDPVNAARNYLLNHK